MHARTFTTTNSMAISVSTCTSPALISSKQSFSRRYVAAIGGTCKNLCSRRDVHAVVAFSTPQDPYSTLGLPGSASEEEIKKARRRLALKFHPDVCKSDSSTAKFIQIEQAYETIMDCLRGKEDASGAQAYYENMHEGMMGVYDNSWEDWEEWMGWEGAGTRDYTSHINHSL